MNSRNFFSELKRRNVYKVAVDYAAAKRKDAVVGPKAEENLASVEVIVDDKNRAIPRLQRLLEIPYTDCLTPSLLRLHPLWDPLRGDPRFQKLCDAKNP
jgi:hypothetical protein